jgi:hypothetical protein
VNGITIGLRKEISKGGIMKNRTKKIGILALIGLMSFSV